jgi:hypothetical protein
MAFVEPWIPVEPSDNPAAILGPLPFEPRTVTYPIPPSVVPPEATGILVFAWCAVSGPIETGWWHIGVNTGEGLNDWFSLLIGTAAPGREVAVCNSQVFWLPMPVDGAVEVTFYRGVLPPGGCAGEVEIHGYCLAG